MIQKQGKSQKIEILAPAGSFESFRAAIAAGADAVYAGGPRFGARAFAENFTEEKLLEAIDYAHLHGRKFYLTVNTLLKDTELAGLGDYLEPLYEGGLDAVIVQDMGVFSYVRTHFPGMDIHVSTQMTVTGAEGARFLKEKGAVRVVPARELSLEEIRHMKEQTGMEIECFVHGALCYCYSGQCLLSSLIGGRSGNRGQCAQPCRLPYTAKGEKGYWLSPKDICTLELIPDLIEAGIDSFKIEGRMKRPEYVAGVTAMYRKYVDLYLEKERDGFRVSDADRELLMDLYNRGGFHQGYYKQHNGKDMMSTKRPNHAGVAAVKVTAQKGREVTGKALTGIHKGDVIEFAAEKENYTFGAEYKKGQSLMLLAPKGSRIVPGTLLYRTKNQQLLAELAETYVSAKIQEKIYGFLTLSAGKPAKLVVCKDSVSAEAVSETLVEQAAKSPLDEDRVRRQIQKTGSTAFVFEQLDILLEGEVFLPMQQMNELRRTALDRLESALCQRHHRKPVQNMSGAEEDIQETIPDGASIRTSQTGGEKQTSLRILVETEEQLRTVSEFADAERIYVDSAMEGNIFSDSQALSMCRMIRAEGREVFLALPHIFREKTDRLFSDRYAEVINRDFDGVLVRNLESLQFLRKSGFDRTVILDHNLYVFNCYTKAFWEACGVDGFTIPLELNRQEIGRLGADHGELLIYSYLPVMVSAQCMENTVSGCRKKESCTVLTDRLGNSFTVRNRCRECYNVIYNSVPLYLLDQREEIEELKPAGVRIHFSVEDACQVREILEEYRDVFIRNHSAEAIPDTFTRGHFKRGIS